MTRADPQPEGTPKAGDSPSPSWGRLLTSYLHAGLWVGLLGGGAVGALLGIAFVRLDTTSLLLAHPADRLLAVAVLASTLGLLGAVGLSVAAFGCSVVARLFPAARARLRPWRFSIAALGIGAATLFAFFYVAFDVVRDMYSNLGLATLAAFALVPPLLLVWLGSGRPTARGAAWRVPWLGAAGVGALLLASAGILGWGLPQLQHAETRPGPPASRAGGAPAATSQTSTARAPRVSGVVLISIDTLRADHLSVYGYRRPTSPSLSSLARDGTVFEEAHSEAPWTLPSHASLLTGLYPWVNGACYTDDIRFFNSNTSSRLGPEQTTLAERLDARGYRTAGFASLKWLGPTFGLSQGFQTFHLNSQHVFGSVEIDEGLSWLHSVGHDPFFLFLHLADVHEYRSPEPTFRRYYAGNYRGKVLAHPERTVANAWQSLSPQDLRYLEARYDAAIDYTDSQLGRLFSELATLGLYDDALIIVTADHGEEFLDHGGTGHGFQLYEEDLHVPLIVKPPRGFRIATSRSRASVALIDVVPTVLDYLGLPPAPGLAGRSLRPVIAGEPLPARTLYAGCSLLLNNYAAFDGRLKVIESRIPPFGLFQPARWLPNLRAFYKFEGPQLYDLSVDPEEKHDLAAAEPAVTSRLRRRLLRELARHRRSGASFRMDAETLEQLRALGYVR